MSNIQLIVAKDPQEVAVRAAGLIAKAIASKPRPVIGLATGSTPELTYKELIRQNKEEKVSWANVTTFNLDEYWGLDGDHDQSYRYFMNERLFKHIDVRLWNTNCLNGKAVNPTLECQAYEQKILAMGGVDLFLLGIGLNGHIAFNEPGSTVDTRTRIVSLSEDTIKANSDGRFFKNAAEVPRCALSTGIGTIRDSRRVVLIATGPKKADAIQKALEGPFSPNVPASLLQDHTDVIFLVDADAASKLSPQTVAAASARFKQ